MAIHILFELVKLLFREVVEHVSFAKHVLILVFIWENFAVGVDGAALGIYTYRSGVG